jgi:hypothetical protein
MTLVSRANRRASSSFASWGHHVEPGRGRGLRQSPRQLEFDLVFGGDRALLIAP